VVREARHGAAVVRGGDGDRARVGRRVALRGLGVVARGEDDEAPFAVRVVDGVEQRLLVDAGLHVAPGVGADLGAHVRAVDERLGEAARGRGPEAHGDHELDARARRLAAGDARDADAVAALGGEGPRAVRAVVRAGAVQGRVVVRVVVAVAVVDVAVAVVVDAVAADLAGVRPDVALQIRVVDVDAVVDDLDDDVRRARGRVPGAPEVDRVRRRRREERVVGHPVLDARARGLDGIDARAGGGGPREAARRRLAPAVDGVPEVEARGDVRVLELARGAEDARRRAAGDRASDVRRGAVQSVLGRAPEARRLALHLEEDLRAEETVVGLLGVRLERLRGDDERRRASDDRTVYDEQHR